MFDWIKNHKYSLWMLYFIFYGAAFVILEQMVVPKYIIECSLDSKIPFCEWFIFPYASWYITMPLSLIFFMFKEEAAFKRLCFIMFGGMTFALFIYAVLPNGLNLRGEIVNDNIASRLCLLLREIDTPTNVCPSIHASSAVATDMAVQTSETFKNNVPVRIISFIMMIAICASTVFLKQHSIIDIICGAAVSVVLFALSERK